MVEKYPGFPGWAQLSRIAGSRPTDDPVTHPDKWPGRAAQGAKRTAMQPRSSPPAEFGAILRQLRVTAELSQEELAERARVSVDAIGALERGRRKAPQRETVDLLLAALQPTPDERAVLLAAANRARLRNVEPGSAPSPAARHNLPHALNDLVGRENAIAEIGSRLRDAPLVTVVGAGGIGKTRTALEVAAQQVDDWADGVWFVELAPMSDAALVAGTILMAIGGMQEAEESPLDALVRRLRNKRALLLLDNCEHLIDEVARVAEELLRRCRQARLLATSREPLRIDGERVYRLAGLDDRSAAALFVQRARGADPEFLLAERDAGVADVCRRLDGMPLAIELAAARIRMMTLTQLARGLDERFAILKGGNRTAAARQQTMQALLDWSYDLLTPEEQRFFRALAVFAGGCGLEGAAAVCVAPGGEATTTLASLVDKSLVVAVRAGDELRYTLLESMRDYALKKLEEAGARDEVSRRHVAFVAELVDSISRRRRDLARAGLTAEMENIRAALSWCAASGDSVQLGARILTNAALVYTQRLQGEYLTRARYFLERADRIDAATVGAIWLGIARRAVGVPALEAAEHAIEVLEKADVRDGTQVRAHLKRAQALAQQNRISEALEENSKVMKLRDAICPHDAAILASIHHQRGFIFGQLHDHAAARDEYRMAATLFEAIGDANGAAYMGCNAADSHYREGDIETAERLTRENLFTFREAHNWDGEAFALCNLAEFEIVSGNLAAAATSIAGALDAACRLASDTWLAVTSLEAAALAARTGDLRSAARLFGYVRSWREQRAYHEAGDARIQSETEELLAGLSPRERALLESEGACLSEEAVAELIRGVLFQNFRIL